MRRTKAEKEMEQKREERRALDRAVSEKVFGWTYRGYGNGGGEWKLDGKIVSHGNGPEWSEDIVRAWQVVEEMNNRDMGMELYRFNSAVMPKAHECRFYEDYDGYWSANADTAPLAICLAALKAVGYEVPS